jgi:hypothetical protein
MKQKYSKIINFIRKKGLIFLIDIVLIAIACLFLLFLIFFLRRKQEIITFTVKVTDRDILYAKTNPSNTYSYAFNEGDTEKSELGRTIAEIVSVDSIQETPHVQTVYLDVRAKATYSPRSNKYTFKGRPIVFGQPFVFEFSNVKTEGIVVDFPGFLLNTQVKEYKQIIKVQVAHEERSFSDVYGIRTFEADAIKIGDQILNSNGETMITVLDKEVYPSKRTVINGNGKSMIVYDPQLKDVFLTLEVSIKEINDKIYALDYIPIYIGGSIPLNFKNISVWPVIIEIEDE